MKTDDQKELERFLFDFGRIVLGKDTGGMIAKLKNARGVTGAWNALKDAAKTSDAKEYVGAILRHQESTKPVVDHDAVAARHGYHWNGDKYIKQEGAI